MVGINTSGFDNEDAVGSEYDRPEPGRYHVVIKSVDESFQESDSVIVDFEVVAGDVVGQEGKSVREYFSVSAKAIKRLQRLALVTQLIAPNSPEVDVQFAAAVGRQLVVEAIEEEYDGKKRTKVAFMGMWSVGNPNVADVPKHGPTLALIQGAAVPQAAPQPQPVAAVPQQPVAAAPAPVVNQAGQALPQQPAAAVPPQQPVPQQPQQPAPAAPPAGDQWANL